MKNNKLFLIAFIFIFSDASAGITTNGDLLSHELSSIHKKDKISTMERHMENRGLTGDAIDSIKKSAPDGYFESVDDQLQKIRSVFSSMDIEKANRYVFNRVRGGFFNSYTSYGEIIGVLQNSYKIALTAEELQLVRTALI